ncbi:lysophospholipase [Oscillibacter valericigenes]|uniref:alpha/beta hydrolase n=1 Tax=Oscillibacter valericigenes TaxID=351091 RepID=UPI001F2F8779|nr:alpha/beta hydrolase [Oscillibacter valericigenes]MCF2663453.1 lysophospholipase [Oscillibacter valericigenes]
MVRNEFTFLSADGKTPIHAVEWLPESQVRAVLQISHGVSEYILRYEPFAEYLTARGFAVVGHDHLGHGQSVAEGSARLYFGPKGSWNWVVDDIDQRRNLAKEKFPQVPYFLLGHSMGSFLARTYLIRYPGAVDAVVIMGTGQMPPAVIAGGMAVAAEEARRVGEDQVSPLVDKLSFGAYNKRFAPNRTNFDWLSLNQDNVDRYIADPLCGGNATIGLFREMLGGLSFIAKPKNLKRMNLNIPVLFISGEMDPVGDCGKGVQRAYESFRKAGVRDVSLKLYPELRHEILNDTCRETVYDDIYQWLAAKVPAAV